MHHAAEVRIRPLTRSELDRLMAWAAAEGWNPGRNDGDLFWATDPEGFLAAEVDGGFAGGGAIVSYGGAYGFMGLFIVDPLLRGRGIGGRLWHARRDRRRARLAPGAAIEMDGVFAMQAFYARGGFAFRHRELRFEWTAPRGTTAAGPAAIVPLADVPAAERHAFDRLHFPAERAAFMDRWITQPGCVSLHAVRDELRDVIVPINKKYPIAELLQACRDYPGASNARRITFEYVMLKGVNDTLADAKELVRLLKGIPAKINLIPFNAWPGAPYECSDWAQIEKFAEVVNRAGYASPVRTPRGRDIMAACGQLKSESVKERAADRMAREQSAQLQRMPH